jgi:hypothetical protein
MGLWIYFLNKWAILWCIYNKVHLFFKVLFFNAIEKLFFVIFLNVQLDHHTLCIGFSHMNFSIYMVLITKA